MQAEIPSIETTLRYKINELEIKHPKDLICNSKNQIRQMCINPQCIKYSLHCDKESCNSCRKKEHIDCQVINMERVTSCLNQHMSMKINIVKDVEQIENKFMSELHSMNQQLKENLCLAGLKVNQRKIISDMYEKNNYKCLKGKEAREFFYNVEEYGQNEPSMKEINDIIEKCNKQLKQTVKRVTQTKQLFCKLFKPKYIDKNLYDSKILTLNHEHFNTLSQYINDPIRVERVEMIYRASEHNFSVAAFHEYCDNKKDTLLLIRTQFGKTIGGYTHYPWNSGPGHLQSRAFIFSLDMKQKLVPQNSDNVIYCGKTYGPIFGSSCGHDLRIYDENCSNNRNSYVNFPSTFNRVGDNKLTKDSKDYNKLQQTYKQFAGDHFFKVIEYEVFQLFYE